MRHYHNQLRYKPDRTFFHLELHGSVLDNVQELKQALIQCSCLESMFLDDFQCDRATWRTLQECLQILAVKHASALSSTISLSSQSHHARRNFKLQLRRIQILFEEEDVIMSDPTLSTTSDSDTLVQPTSGAYLAKSLAELSPYLSELHVMDCDIPSYGAQLLFTTMTNNSDPTYSRIQSLPLQLLSLEGNTAMGNVGMTFLAQALSSGCLEHLQTLSVERVGASQDGLCTLFDAIRHHPNLACLNIMGNVLDHPTLQYLLNVLIQDNTILQHIQWDRSMIVSPASKPTTNATIPSSETELPITVDPSSSPSVPTVSSLSSLLCSIEFWLRLNRAGRRWIVQDSQSWSLPVALWPRILQRFSHRDPDLLYYVLRSRPEFCSSSNHGHGRQQQQH